jgi:hypothetical protein
MRSSAQMNNFTSSSSSAVVPPVDDRVWVQCNTCDKWRALPSTVNPDALPDIWTCSLNIYDPDRMSCDAPEENYYANDDTETSANLQLKSFLRLWCKKLRTADRAEQRLNSNNAISSVTRGLNTTTTTRGKVRNRDVEWIRCSSSSCGKWRAIARGIDSMTLLRRLNKNRKFGEGLIWYCTMNSWDETIASCAAPQEPLWNCYWNLTNLSPAIATASTNPPSTTTTAVTSAVPAASTATVNAVPVYNL